MRILIMSKCKTHGLHQWETTAAVSSLIVRVGVPSRMCAQCIEDILTLREKLTGDRSPWYLLL